MQRMQRKRRKQIKKRNFLLFLGTAVLLFCAGTIFRHKPRPETPRDTVLSAAGTKADPEAPHDTVVSVARTCIIRGIPHYNQKENYPTGCESVAAVSLMQYYGIDISIHEFIDDYLPKAGRPVSRGSDTLYGESPWEYFIGNPRAADGCGCYAPVIVNAMNDILTPDYHAEFRSDASLAELSEEYVAKETPVLIWATIGMARAVPGLRWILPDGTDFTFLKPEHALLLIGYDENFYYFSDSLSDKRFTAYQKGDCEKAFTALGCQAVIIQPR